MFLNYQESVTDDAVDGRIGFETDGRTLRIRDALEGEEFPLRFDREPRPQTALPDLFHTPVDRAVSFEAESVSIPNLAAISVRDADGNYVARLNESTTLNRGTYFVDISGVTKAFIRIPDVEISATGMGESEGVELIFDRPVTVTVGARSLHTRPEATITVPDDPAALAEAISVLGSSIKEFTPERSWPTLRGYPPRIRIGDELDIPSPLVAPDTGVEVVVRPTYADVYRLSTLAYYLGARVVVGDAPAIHLDTGYVESLPTDGVALEERVEELLRTWFFLDTLARTEGYVKSDRYEYEQVGAELPFYPPNLVDMSMSGRLMEYLEVDSDAVRPYTPAWPTEAVLRPVPEAAELLPHLAHLLAPIRVRGSADSTADAPVSLATSPWMKDDQDASDTDVIPSPDDVPIPTGVSVLSPASYENRLRGTTTARGDIRTVVLTRSAERAGRLRRALSDPAVPGGVGSWEVIDRPDADTVSAVLSDSDVDIAYCALPVEDRQIAAANGTVPLTDLGSSPAFVAFEGCTDLTLGRSVVDSGGLSSVLIEGALSDEQFRSLVGLLSFGVPTTASVTLAGIDATTTLRCVGDPSTEVASHSYQTMAVYEVRSNGPDSHHFERGSVLSLSARIGGEQKQLLDGFQPLAEIAGRLHIDGPTLDTAALFTLLEQADSVIRLNGRLLLPEDVETESDIEWLVRRQLSEESESEEHSLERRSEQRD